MIIYFLTQCSPSASFFCLLSLLFFPLFPMFTIRAFCWAFFFFSLTFQDYILHSNAGWIWCLDTVKKDYLEVIYHLTNTTTLKLSLRISSKISTCWVNTWNRHSQKSMRVFFIYLFLFQFIQACWLKKQRSTDFRFCWEVGLARLEVSFFVSTVSKMIHFTKGKGITEIINKSRNKC